MQIGAVWLPPLCEDAIGTKEVFRKALTLCLAILYSFHKESLRHSITMDENCPIMRNSPLFHPLEED